MARKRVPPAPTNTMTGTNGNDTLIAGNDGDYTLYGYGGNDQLYGKLGADTIYGGDGNDLIDDSYSGNDNKNDLLYGGNGNDTISSTSGADLLDGGAGDDALTASGSGSTLLGGEGNDRLVVNSSATDVMVDGGAGYDVAHLEFDKVATPLHLDLTAGQAVTIAETGTNVQNVEAYEIEATKGDDFIALTANDDFAFGNDGDDTLIGRDGNDELSGYDGSDEVDGGSGDDSLAGGYEQDILTGGDGADEFQFGDEVEFAGHDDVITDFDLAEGDVISFALAYEQDDSIFYHPQDALGEGYITLVDTAEGVLVQTSLFGPTVDVAVLVGITAAEVTNDHFVF